MSTQPLSARDATFLFTAARTAPSPAELDTLRRCMRDGVDWERTLRAAGAHGVMPLLHASVTKAGGADVPAWALRRVHDAARGNIPHAFFLTAELLRLLQAFRNERIPVVPFKGPVLAASAYGDVTLREFSDLDLFVRRADIPAVGRLLLAAGYAGHAGETQPVTGAGGRQVALRHRVYHTFYRHDGRCRVDVQSRIMEKYFVFSLERDDLWDPLTAVAIHGHAVDTFSPTDTLLILCIHGSKHRWEKLKWICDVAELIRARGSSIDWLLLRRKAAACRGERMVRLGVSLARQVLGVPLPPPVESWVTGDGSIRPLTRDVERQLMMPPGGAVPALRRVRFFLRLRDGWRDRAGFCAAYVAQRGARVVVPNAHDRALLPLPPQLAFLYFGLRPLRLLAHYTGLAHRARRPPGTP